MAAVPTRKGKDHMKTETQREHVEDGDRDRRTVPTSRGSLRMSGDHQKLERGKEVPPLEPSEGVKSN